jgi:hypothetical protein
MPLVRSSVMTEVAYDETTRELDITFTSGRTYRYFKVPPDIYNDLLDAGSKGAFFNDYIRDAFDFNEVNRRLR